MIAGQMEKYSQFIRVIMERIDAHFVDQKDYIHCKEGCSKCCENGEYPCSELEFEFLKLGFMTLPLETRKIITDKIEQLKKEKAQFKGKKFIYTCPFLINHRCNVYRYRMIICRTFGLSYYDMDEKTNKYTVKIPFCSKMGLNYSEVYDPKINDFSKELYEKTGYEKPPVVYNLGVEFLMNKFGKEIMGLDFGELKTLLEWL
ncbi:MAG: hypothetical protein SPL76_01280 [Cyanobacteriota bacterium]|nr:hypothetical protein [Cyanobacteriota bacterium]MDY6358127.1 hypothetical protein [Cyanobacteriota bacterium]